jgi:hypothetical protein
MCTLAHTSICGAKPQVHKKRLECVPQIHHRHRIQHRDTETHRHTRKIAVTHTLDSWSRTAPPPPLPVTSPVTSPVTPLSSPALLESLWAVALCKTPSQSRPPPPPPSRPPRPPPSLSSLPFAARAPAGSSRDPCPASDSSIVYLLPSTYIIIKKIHIHVHHHTHTYIPSAYIIIHTHTRTHTYTHTHTVAKCVYHHTYIHMRVLRLEYGVPHAADTLQVRLAG